MRLRFALLLVALVVLRAGFGADTETGAPGPHPAFPPEPRKLASAAFHEVWSDGKAELTGYDAIVPRYGDLRHGELVLIYVTEPMSRRTWIKDDGARGADRVNVLKLNESLKFLTGLYPYSVLTSVFAPVDDWRGERFSPVKISMSSQEWCGHVFSGLWPGGDRFLEHVLSYFESEGEATRTVTVPEGTLYEDALLIQLRELDGPFASGGDWSGSLVPALWRIRRAHQPSAAVAATIKRSSDETTTRFVLEAGEYRREFRIERAAPHRVLGWTTSEGEDVKLLKSARLAYWNLHGPGDEKWRAELGITPTSGEKIAPPEGVRVGR